MSRFRRGAPDHHPSMSNLELAVFDVLNADSKLKEAPRIEEAVWFHYHFATHPDFMFPLSHVLVYIDGPHHGKKIHADRDARVNKLAVADGWHVQRFKYDGKYTTKQIEFIAINIRSAVNHRVPRVEEIEL